jgi:hypothetical protein
MKFALANLTILVGLAGAAYCQDGVRAQDGRSVHPGTALLDSEGIFAGAPDPARTNKAQASTENTSMPGATVTTAAGKR